MSDQTTHPNAVATELMVALMQSKSFFSSSSNIEIAKEVAAMYKIIWAAANEPK